MHQRYEFQFDTQGSYYFNLIQIESIINVLLQSFQNFQRSGYHQGPELFDSEAIWVAHIGILNWAKVNLREIAMIADKAKNVEKEGGSHEALYAVTGFLDKNIDINNRAIAFLKEFKQACIQKGYFLNPSGAAHVDNPNAVPHDAITTLSETLEKCIKKLEILEVSMKNTKQSVQAIKGYYLGEKPFFSTERHKSTLKSKPGDDSTVYDERHDSNKKPRTR